MIVEALMNVLYNVFSVLFVVSIPQLPEDVFSYVNTVFDYMVAGGGIVANYVPLGYFVVLLGILLAVDAGILIYHFIMWIVRKIPMAGMS